jgi:ArsR family transcriptional regulator
MRKLIATIQQNCCPPDLQPAFKTEEAEKIARLFAAMADSTRVSILNLLAQSPDAVCVCDITGSFKLGQPTISHHLRILKEAGLITGDKRGKWVHYSLVEDRAEEAKALLAQIFSAPVLTY